MPISLAKLLLYYLVLKKFQVDEINVMSDNDFFFFFFEIWKLMLFHRLHLPSTTIYRV